MSSGPSFDPKNMPVRRFGGTGMRVSAMSYGGWLTLGKGQKGDVAKELVKTSFEAGINTFDTAEIYANGESELELGRAIKELGYNRDELVIITKLFFGTGRKDGNQNGLSRKHLTQGMKASLARLQMDYVDVVFAHRYDVGTSMEEIVRGFNFLIDQGWAFYWGTSEWSAAQIEEAQGVAARLGLQGPSAEQPQYSLLHRERFEKEYEPLFHQYRYGTTIWSPLASGLLTGKYDEGIPEDSRFATNSDFFKGTVSELQTDAGKAKLDKVRKLKGVADKLGCDRAALALAWTLKNENVSTVLLGATKPQQLHDNFKALDVLPKLTDEVMKEIEDIFQNKPEPVAAFGRARS